MVRRMLIALLSLFFAFGSAAQDVSVPSVATDAQPASEANAPAWTSGLYSYDG
jgi:hypothetical protein